MTEEETYGEAKIQMENGDSKKIASIEKSEKGWTLKLPAVDCSHPYVEILAKGEYKGREYVLKGCDVCGNFILIRPEKQIRCIEL